MVPIGTTHNIIISQVNTEELKLLLETSYLYHSQSFKNIILKLCMHIFCLFFNITRKNDIYCQILNVGFSLSRFAPLLPNFLSRTQNLCMYMVHTDDELMEAMRQNWKADPFPVG
ncbi:unnamed protein product [Meganyctiphanes norvegica]|uniref:Uncharacterized protein n=1 Tax=Meganyctiphanes norvegica TaxID=48144 RepID=A0AAV2ST64_MEGNR